MIQVFIQPPFFVPLNLAVSILHAIPWQREPVIRGNQVGAWLPALRMFQQMPLWRLVATETTYSAVISVAR